jgi:bacteriochlorophyll C20 methyltransferase
MDDQSLFVANRAAYDMVFKGTVDFFSLKAALDLKLFETLAERPYELQNLAEVTGTVPQRLLKFLMALDQIGLVQQKEDGCWKITPFAEQFFTAPEDHRNLTMVPFVEYLSEVINSYYHNLADVVRGKLNFTSMIPYPPRTQADSLFYETLHRSNTYYPIKLLLEEVDLEGVNHLVDMGGGIGDIAIALCKKYPNLNVTLLNLPSAIDLICENVEKAGLHGRITPKALDMYREPLPKADAVLVSRILYPFGVDFSKLVCRQASSALESGGKFCLVDLNVSDRQNPNYDYLTHYLSSIGTDFVKLEFKHHDTYFDILGDLGFGDIRKSVAYDNVLFQAVKQ